MIREASVYTLKKSSPDEQRAYGIRVLIMRSWPRGISRRNIDLWLPDAAPPKELLANYRAGHVCWYDFCAQYRLHQVTMVRSCRVINYLTEERQPMTMEHQMRPLDYVRGLEREYSVLTVLCWEKDDHCHRFLFKELVEQSSLEMRVLSSFSSSQQGAKA